MRLAQTKQKFQDWFTQQWAIWWGKRIEPREVPWLMGPFGKQGAIGDQFVYELAEKEGLTVERNSTSQGILASIDKLKLSAEESGRLSQQVVDFYETTARYQLNFSVRWNPFFKIFGRLVNFLFSNRIKQLNVPISNSEGAKQISSEIITLSDPASREVKHTIWYRTFKSTGKVLYSGVYTTCTLPSGQNCVKAVFPLPHGNATVILSPHVGREGDLCLKSAGKKFGDPGFYFLLRDAKGGLWAQYLKSFRDELKVSNQDGKIIALQTLTLWRMRVLQFEYEIGLKS